MDSDSFNYLSNANTLFGNRSLSEVKFLITDIDSDTPEIYFMNTNNYPNHYYFYVDVLGNIMTLYDFNRFTYYPFNIGGQLIRNHDVSRKAT